MSGVWVFDNGVIRLVERAGAAETGAGGRRKVLIYKPTNEAMTSYPILKNKLASLGWEVYYEDSEVMQFHKPSSVDLISIPTDFNKLKARHLYDIVVKNRNVFQVKDMQSQ
ncbi:flowering-promoting factor 1-like protein 1 [Cucurbita pepo subsp. pepo]|uniref:flowering-promoting factor 1-like protein 1 n=1 Tax=Cucurbita pepo subsp. pepo TaxID=3664 RepID=UPI000C9D5B5D|nr:flowering-promoting factor 1-like protein 1 [Cucurbita pepo subsp. pepo]